MADEGFKRKLTAILSADAVGYSRLMRDDEESTVRDLAAHRVLITDIIKQNNGRVIDSPGDNILAEFASVVDAVKGSIKIQEEINNSNADTSQDRRMEFRIGINLGDVIEEEDRIYGDGVNIAARVEGLASPGGIAISGTVYEHIKEKLSLGYHYLGEQNVKNIPEPVRVYRLLTAPEEAGKLIGADKKSSKTKLLGVAAAIVALAIVVGIWQFFGRRPPIEAASQENMAYPLPDKPSIAVLPFDNLSSEKKQEYFSDGLSEGIINGLAKNDRLFVIARNSTFTYKDKPTNVRQIAEDLGVRYVLEGSIQKAGDNVRVTAQLIDALSGFHLFSERYDRELKDIFRVQDEITKKVLTELLENLTLGTSAAPYEKGTDNLDAYLKVMQARDYKNTQVTKERVFKAMQLLEEAIALDPGYAPAYSILSTAHFDLVTLGASDDPKKSLRTAIELGKKAIALDDSNPSVHAHMVYLYIMTRNFDKAFEEAEKAVSISPNYAGGYFALGFAFVNTGQFQKAISALEKCLRLSPTPISSNVLVLLGNSYLNLGKYEEAIVTFKKALNIFGQDQLFVHIGLAQTYVLMDLEKEAQTEAAEIMRIDPDFSIVQFLKPWPMSREKKDQIAAILRKTGLPEHPTLPLPDKPSIAVLAFDNLSGDPEQEYLSDGFTEDIINSLAKIPKMFVIARNSSFTFKGKPVKVQQVSKELGVRYILEGSVRKSENQLRITAQLIDAIAGNHLWAERYDRKIEELFNIQDEITKSIITALQVILTEGEQIVVYGKGTRNLDAYIKYLQTREQFLKFDKDGVIRARKMAKETIALDSKYANGYALLAWTNLFDVWFGMTKSPKESFQQAIQLANKAIDLDNSLHNPYRLLSHTYTLMRQYDKAVNAGERALELGPNSADAHATMGQTLNYAGRPDEAINLLEKAIRLNPYPPSWYLHNLGGAYISAGRYGEAVEVLKKAVDRQPKDQFAHLGLTIAYILVGRKDQAVIEAKEVMKINPNFKLIHFEKTAPYKNKDSLKLRTDALREAGF